MSIFPYAPTLGRDVVCSVCRHHMRGYVLRPGGGWRVRQHSYSFPQLGVWCPGSDRDDHVLYEGRPFVVIGGQLVRVTRTGTVTGDSILDS